MSITLGGTEPTNYTSLFEDSQHQTLDPEYISGHHIHLTVREGSYRIESHHGPFDSNATWIAIGDFIAAESEFELSVIDAFGPLSTNGKSYRATLDSTIITANEEFIAYPFLSSPRIALEETGPTNELLITYGEGIYSNQINYTHPSGQKSDSSGYPQQTTTPSMQLFKFKRILWDPTLTNNPAP